MADGTVLVEIKLSDDSFRKAVKDSEGAVQSGAQNITSSLGSLEATTSQIFNRISNSFLKMSALIGVGFGVASVVNFAKECAMLDARLGTLSVSLHRIGLNAGYTSSQMDGFVNAIKSKGITTKEGTESLMRMSQAQMDLTQSTKLARIAQDAAVIANLNSSDAFSRLIYGIQTMQPEMLRLLGINVNFEESYSKMAISLGKTTSELTKREKVQAGLNAVLREGEKMEGLYEEAMTTSGKQITSTKRYIQELQEQVGKSFGPATGSLVKSFNDKLQELTKWLQEPANKEKISEIGEKLKSFAENVWKACSIVIDGIKILFEHIDKIGAAIRGLAIGLEVYLAGKLVLAAISFGKAIVAAESFGAALTALSIRSIPLLLTPLGLIATAIGAIAAAFIYFNQNSKKAGNTLEDFGKQAKSFSFEEAQKKVGEFEASIKEKEARIADLKKKISESWESPEAIAGESMGGGVQALEDEVKSTQQLIDFDKQRLDIVSKITGKLQEQAGTVSEEAKAAESRRKIAEDEAREQEIKMSGRKIELLKLATEYQSTMSRMRLADINKEQKGEQQTKDYVEQLYKSRIQNERTLLGIKVSNAKKEEDLAMKSGRGKGQEVLAQQIANMGAETRLRIKEMEIEKEEKLREANYEREKQGEESIFSYISYKYEQQKQLITDNSDHMRRAYADEVEIIEKTFNDRVQLENKYLQQKYANIERQKEIDIAGNKFDWVKYYADLAKSYLEFTKATDEIDRQRNQSYLELSDKRQETDLQLAKTADALSMDTYNKELDRLTRTYAKDYAVSKDREAIQRAYTAEVLKLQQQRAQGELSILEQTLGYDNLIYQKRVELIQIENQQLTSTEFGKNNPGAVAEATALKLIEANTKLRNSVETVKKSIRDIDVGLTDISFGDKMADGINKVVASLENVNTVLEKQASARLELIKLEEQANAIRANDPTKAAAMDLEIESKREQMVQAQIGSWRKVATAAKDYFKEGSDGYKAMHALEMTLAAIEMAMTIKRLAVELGAVATLTAAKITGSEAVTAVKAEEAVVGAVASCTAAGSGDPYTGFVRVAAMVALMAGLLAVIGKSLSSGGSKYSATPKPMNTTLGGTYTGGSSTESYSQSVENTAKYLQDIYKVEYTELTQMNFQLRALNVNFAGLTAAIFRSNLPSGQGFGGISLSFFQKFYDTFNYFVSMKWLSKIPIIGGVLGALSSIGGSIMSGFFGGKISSEVKEFGIAMDGVALASIEAGKSVNAFAYQLMEVKQSGPLWGVFGGGRTWVEQQTQALNTTVNRSIQLIYKGMSDTLVGVSKALGTDVQAAMEYIFPGGKLNLKGLSSEEAKAQIEGYFNSMADTAAEVLFGKTYGIFQKMGEGMYETVQRLVADRGAVKELLRMAGTMTDQMNPLDMIELSEALIDVAGSLSHLEEITKGFIDNFYTDSQKFQLHTFQLNDIMKNVGATLPATREGYLQLVQSQNLLTESGREAYITLLEASDIANEYYSYQEEAMADLADKAKQFFDDFATGAEKLESALGSISQLFVNFGLDVIPGTRAEFKVLVDQMDKSSEQYKAFMAAEAEAANFYSLLEEQRQERIDAARKELDEVYNREKEKITDAVTAANNAIKPLEDEYNRLDSARKKMAESGGESELTAKTYQSALSELQRAVTASASGQKYELSDRSLNALTGTDQKKFYSTQQDYLRQFWQSYNKISKLTDSAKEQLTDQQKMVEYLKEEQDTLEKMYEALVNGAASTKSLEDAIEAWKTAQLEQGSILIDTSKYIPESASEDANLVMKQIQGSVDSAYDNATNTQASIVETTSAVNTASETSSSWWQKILGTIGDIFKGILGAITTVVTSIWDAIKWVGNIFGEGLKWIGNALNSAFQAIGNVLGKVGSVLGDVASQIGKGITGAFNTVIGGVKNFFSDAVSAIGGLFGGGSKAGFGGWTDYSLGGATSFGTVPQPQIGFHEMPGSNGNTPGELQTAFYQQYAALVSNAFSYLQQKAGDNQQLLSALKAMTFNTIPGVSNVTSNDNGLTQVRVTRDNAQNELQTFFSQVEELIISQARPLFQQYGISAKSGLDYVPRDDYMIKAHEGEAVITKEENIYRMMLKRALPTSGATDYSTSGSDQSSSEQLRDLVKEMKELRDEMKKSNYVIARNTQSTSKYLERWDGNGMPEVRDLTA